MAKKNNDATTMLLIAEVKKRKEEIVGLEKPNYKTNCSFSYSENSRDSINLHTECVDRNLIMMVGFLVQKQESYNKGILELDLSEAPNFTWHGFSVADWIHDIKLRLGKIQIASKRKQLESIQARLDAIISPEAKATMELEAIKNELEFHDRS